MKELVIVAIIAIVMATANLIYCAVSIRADLARGRRGLAILGAIVTVGPIVIIGWSLWAWTIAVTYPRH